MSNKFEIFGVFGVPDGHQVTDDLLKNLMLKSVKKFHGMAQFLPELPKEFALVIVAATKNNPVEAAYAAIIEAKSEVVYIHQIKESKKIYDIEVLQLLKKPDFTVETAFSEEAKLMVPKYIILN
jgi:hypothetical protein